MPSEQFDLVKSLGNAADAARQIYNCAQAANPGADLSDLYRKQNKALNAWSNAQRKMIEGDEDTLAVVKSVQQDLESVTADVRGRLKTLKSVTEAVEMMDQLLKAALSLAAFL